MNDTVDTAKLDTCGCCQAGVPLQEHHNPPGQPSLSYRLATHAAFLRRMLNRFPTQTIPDGPNKDKRPLLHLSTRSLDDPSIAFLDAWATALDVITFYEERIINEGYLLTATERRSVLDLARAIGYELNPGVAASTYLAFTVEDAEGSPCRATIGEGVKVMSVPGQDEQAQTFETVEEIEARAEWNAVNPQLTVPQEIDRGLSELFLKGIDTQLQPGDAILLVGDERERYFGSECWDFRILQTVETYPEKEKNYTRVTWQEALGHEGPTIEPADNPKVFAFRQRAALFGHNAPDWRLLPPGVKGTDWPGFNIRDVAGADNAIVLDANYPKILEGSWLVLAKPTYSELYGATKVSFGSRTDFTLSAKTTIIELDIREHLTWFGLRETAVFAQSEQLELADKPVTEPVYGSEIPLDKLVPALEKDRALIVSGKATRRLKVAERTQVVKVGDREVVRPAPDLMFVPSAPSGAASRRLKVGDGLEVVHPPSLELAHPPSTHPEDIIHWRLKDSDGRVGTVLAKRGDLIPELAAEDEETISEVAFVQNPPDGDRQITITLADPLENIYDRSTLSINANVARATHGETVRETLGTGDGAQPHQRFTLKRPPLTFVSASTPSGGKSTLQVRVNDVLWKEVPSLYAQDERSETYITRIDDDGKASIIFGDGTRGVRLPTGVDVAATYRSGIGLGGEVGAGTLTTLQTRPPGVRDVVNPLEATGAQDPEKLAQARENAPLAVRTLDRIVSLQDFEDFARAFAGIGKAQAVTLWRGEIRLVHITVASASGKEVGAASKVYTGLVRAIDNARDPTQPVQVDSFQNVPFRLVVRLLVDRRYEFEDVRADIEAALKSTFAFEKRAIGQPVTEAEVLTVIQKAKGVVAADLDELCPASDTDGGVTPILEANTAHWDREGTFHKGQLLVLDPANLEVKEMGS